MEQSKANQIKLSSEFTIKTTMLRRFGAEISKKSNLIRSEPITMEKIISDFPDEIQNLAEEVTLRMRDEFILSSICKGDSVYYFLNPNKRDILKNIYNSTQQTFQPPEETIPSNYAKVFETQGVKTTKGFITRYLYYMNPDNSHFYVFIQNSVHGRPEKKDLGSATKKESILGEVWFAIEKKLEKDKFYKHELQSLISNHRIIGNNQPLKAAIDVLEFLNFIEKTGKHIRRSEEYRKTGNQPSIRQLDDFVK